MESGGTAGSVSPPWIAPESAKPPAPKMNASSQRLHTKKLLHTKAATPETGNKRDSDQRTSQPHALDLECQC